MSTCLGRPPLAVEGPTNRGGRGRHFLRHGTTSDVRADERGRILGTALGISLIFWLFRTPGQIVIALFTSKSRWADDSDLPHVVAAFSGIGPKSGDRRCLDSHDVWAVRMCWTFFKRRDGYNVGLRRAGMRPRRLLSGIIVKEESSRNRLHRLEVGALSTVAVKIVNLSDHLDVDARHASERHRKELQGP